VDSKLLHKVAEKGHTAVVALFIEYESKPLGLYPIFRQVDSLGRRPLHLAACSGHTEKVGLLIEKLDGIGVRIERAENQNWTALHLAAHAGHALTVEILVEKGAERRAKIDDHRTPLQLAAQEPQESHLRVLAVLIEKDWSDRARLLDKITPDWEMALSSAAKAGHVPVVRVFFLRQ
jgi:ankyrin repeat protein